MVRATHRTKNKEFAIKVSSQEGFAFLQRALFNFSARFLGDQQGNAEPAQVPSSPPTFVDRNQGGDSRGDAAPVVPPQGYSYACAQSAGASAAAVVCKRGEGV